MRVVCETLAVIQVQSGLKGGMENIFHGRVGVRRKSGNSLGQCLECPDRSNCLNVSFGIFDFREVA